MRLSERKTIKSILNFYLATCKTFHFSLKHCIFCLFYCIFCGTVEYIKTYFMVCEMRKSYFQSEIQTICENL